MRKMKKNLYHAYGYSKIQYGIEVYERANSSTLKKGTDTTIQSLENTVQQRLSDPK